MAKARRRDEWARASSLIAMVHNCAWGREAKDAKGPDDFNPYSDRPAVDDEPLEVPFETLKVFLAPNAVRNR